MAAKRRVLRIASGRFAIPSESVRTLRLRVSRRARVLVRGLGRLRVRVEAVVSDSAGNRGVARKTVGLRAAKTRRKS